MRRFLALAAVAMGIAVAAPAGADETWTTTQFGQVVWAEDLGDTSVFTYTLPDGSPVRLYVEGLPGNTDNRRVMSGYWMFPGHTADTGLCGATLTAPDGTTSNTWGRLELRWAKRTFPSAWTARMTDCFAGPTTTLRARPNVG